MWSKQIKMCNVKNSQRNCYTPMQIHLHCSFIYYLKLFPDQCCENKHLTHLPLKDPRHPTCPGFNLFLLPLILSNAHPLFNDRHAGSPLLLKNSNRLSIDCQLVPGWDNWSPSSFETGKCDAFVPFLLSLFRVLFAPPIILKDSLIFCRP